MLPYKKKKFPLWAKILISTVLIVGPAVLMTFNIVQTQSVSCTVCITYEGTQVCKQASGSTKLECERTGVDNACGSLALGMTYSLRCSSKGPTQITYN